MKRAFTGVGRLLGAATEAEGHWTIVAEDGQIADVRADGDIPPDVHDVCELGTALVTPGLVDSHTHLLYAGDRSDETAERSSGITYAAGGILRTVAATRAAPDEVLIDTLVSRLNAALATGTTTVEVKTGYGLSTADELRYLRLIARAAARVPVRVVETYLGAHSVPPGVTAEEHVAEVVTAIPVVAPLAHFADVFVEDAVFPPLLAERVLRAALAAGLRIRLHADQLARSGAALLGVSLGATSIDHLERATSEDARMIAASRSVACLLPGPALMLRLGLPPARALLDAGGVVAIASDANAGTFGSTDMTLVVGLAAGLLGMTIDEAIRAATFGGAASLGLDDQIGLLAPGFAADLVAWDADHEGSFLHRLGAVRPVGVWMAGERVA